MNEETLKLTALMFEAVTSEYGVIVTCENVQLLQQKLYAIRRKNEDEFSVLSLTIINNELWIVKNANKAGA